MNALVNSKKLMHAESYVHKSEEDARQWFLQLNEHPEAYNFTSHLGFYFTEGNFGEVGSRFYTKERFYGFLIKLTFRLTKITPNSFTIALLKPIRNIDGIFTITRIDTSKTRIMLSLYARSKYIQRIFQIRPLKRAVQKQISSEVEHIKSAMERS